MGILFLPTPNEGGWVEPSPHLGKKSGMRACPKHLKYFAGPPLALATEFPNLEVQPCVWGLLVTHCVEAPLLRPNCGALRDCDERPLIVFITLFLWTVEG